MPLLEASVKCFSAIVCSVCGCQRMGSRNANSWTACLLYRSYLCYNDWNYPLSLIFFRTVHIKRRRLAVVLASVGVFVATLVSSGQLLGQAMTDGPVIYKKC